MADPSVALEPKLRRIQRTIQGAAWLLTGALDEEAVHLRTPSANELMTFMDFAATQLQELQPLVAELIADAAPANVEGKAGA